MIRFINWTITVLLFAAMIGAYYIGFVDYLMDVDRTYLTSVIAVITGVCSLIISVCGIIGKMGKKLETQLNFITTMLPSIGMIGTVIGMILIIQHGIPEPSQLLIGVGTALTTTLMGLIGAVVLSQQLTLKEMQDGKT